MGLIVLIGFFAIPGLAIWALFWLFSAKSSGQGFLRLALVAAIGTLLFWLAFGLFVGIGLEQDAKERQRTTGESLFGG